MGETIQHGRSCPGIRKFTYSQRRNKFSVFGACLSARISSLSGLSFQDFMSNNFFILFGMKSPILKSEFFGFRLMYNFHCLLPEQVSGIQTSVLAASYLLSILLMTLS